MTTFWLCITVYLYSIIFHICDSTDADIGCGENLMTDNGFITSENCLGQTSGRWSITAPKDRVIRLTTKYLNMGYYDLVYDTQCTSNHLLSVYDCTSGNATGPLIGSFCNKMNVEVLSNGNCLIVVWSGNTLSDKFRLQYYFQDPAVGCGNDYFKCSSGRCLSSEYMCDGTDDCKDNTDEQKCMVQKNSLNCGKNILRNSNEGVILSHKHFNHSIYPPNVRCEWLITAPPGLKIRLSSERFSLYHYNGESGDRFTLYDGDGGGLSFCNQTSIDYVSENDELNITFVTDNIYQDMGFKLIYRYQRNSDCGIDYMKCPNNVCVLKEKLCDTFNDCGDMADENDCDYNHDLPWMAISNRTSIRLLSIDNNNVNTSITIDNIQVGKGLDIYYSQSKIVWTGNDNTTLFYNIFNVTDGGVDKEHTLIRLKDKPDFINEVAVDWITGNLYWITNNLIRVSDYLVDKERILISSQLGYPASLELDSNVRYIFWGIASSDSSINTLGMDGDLATLRVLAHHNVYYPGGLTLDLLEKNVYWTDASSGTIEMCSYDGTNRRTIISVIFPMPYRIALYDDVLYWTTYLSEEMYRCDKSDGKNYKQLPISGAQNLRVISKEMRQTDGQDQVNPCKDNGGCEHLCLLSPSKKNFSCACTDGYSLFEERSCVKDPCSSNRYLHCDCYRGSYWEDNYRPDLSMEGIADALVATTSCEIYTLTLETYKKTTVRLNNGSNIPGYVDFDPIENEIYWTERVNDPEIRKSPFGQSDKSKIYIKETGQIWLCGIAVDWISRDLYWCVYSSKMIKRQSLNGHAFSTVVVSHAPIRSMGLDPFYGHVYWLVWEPHSSIYRSNVNGKYTDVVKKSEFKEEPYSLTVDYFNRELHWLEFGSMVTRNLDFINDSLSLMSHEIMYDFKSKYPTVISEAGSFIFWSDFSSVGTIDKISGIISGTYLYPHLIKGVSLDVNALKIVTLTKQDIKPECPTYARCMGTNGYWMCLNRNMICDGVWDCLNGIDEIFCEICNYNNCTSGILNLHCEPDHRSGTVESGLAEFVDWKNHPFSKFISIQDFLSSECSVSLQYYDRSLQQVKRHDITIASSIHVFRQIILSSVLRNTDFVEELILSGKSLLRNIDKDSFIHFYHIRSLTLSSTNVIDLPSATLQNLTSLFNLNISHNGLQTLYPDLLNPFESLEIIDIRGNGVRLTSDVFQFNQKLRIIYSDSYSFCCIKPKSVEACYAPIFDVSSCNDLIQDSVLRVFLWLVGIFAFLGNIGVLINRLFLDKSQAGTFTIFVNNLSISDAVMGLYLLIIAIHDEMYRGLYAWKEYNWRHSPLCKICGILSMMSSEASVGFIVFITLDRFLAVKYPIGGPRLTRKLSHLVSLLVWIVSASLAVLPLFPYQEFYSTSGICIALPITSYFQEGLTYSVVVYFGLNFFLFCILGVGQTLIFREIMLSAAKTKRQLTDREKSVAKMLAWVVMTDFFCWIPIGIMVILALSGVFIPREIYAWVVVFVLPINSAINPFIYTFSGIIRAKVTQFRRKYNIEGDTSSSKVISSANTRSTSVTSEF